ncbi:Uncharacterised protein [Mycobacteroides abscessus subsp. massiliense]|nr:Uncharacterised protein [Mycobacteroides abscessus subsp. massiliense]
MSFEFRGFGEVHILGTDPQRFRRVVEEMCGVGAVGRTEESAVAVECGHAAM